MCGVNSNMGFVALGVLVTLLLVVVCAEGILHGGNYYKDGKPCSVSADCPRNRCCVSRTRPIGRRKKSTYYPWPLPTQPGNCKPVGTMGSSCLKNQQTNDLEKRIFFVNCPCKCPLTCESLIPPVQDIPLGEVGKCEET